MLNHDVPTSIGPYRIVSSIGSGGMGHVYQGRSPGGRAVAVKVIHPHLASEGEFRRRFAREVEAARRVSGVFTAPVVDADLDGSPPWLATAYIPGISLHDAVTSHGPLPAASVLGIAAGVAEALQAIHAAGLVHRDLKPSNVLLASDGPRVIDFGIALSSEASALTRTGTIVGSPAFMSPEQVADRALGPASDVFSLGSTMVFAATGEGPFGSGAAHSLMFRIVYHEPDLTQVPHELRDILTRCLSKDPSERPSLQELMDDLTRHVTTAQEEVTVALHHRGWLPDALARTILGQISSDLAVHDPWAPTQLLSGSRRGSAPLGTEVLPTGHGADVAAGGRVEAVAAGIIAEAESEASRLLAEAASHAQAKRDAADALFEETRAKAAQAAADFEMNLDRRRQQSSRDLAARQAKAEQRLMEIEHRAEELRLEAEALRTEAERRSHQTILAAQRRADDILAGAGTSGNFHGAHENDPSAGPWYRSDAAAQADGPEDTVMDPAAEARRGPRWLRRS